MRTLVMRGNAAQSRFSMWLQDQGDVETATDAEVMERAAAHHEFDMVLLDMTTRPGWDGAALCERLWKSTTGGVAVVVVGRTGMLCESLQMLDSGADRCFTPSVPQAEFSAHVRAIFRRRSLSAGRVLHFGDLSLDRASRVGVRNGRSARLNAQEFEILQLLMQSPGEVVTRVAIAEQVWGIGNAPRSNAIEAHVCSLRKQIDSDRAQRLIHTVPLRGYRLGRRRPGDK